MTESNALKEWSLALRAVSERRQIILIRKGGIVEETGAFDVVAETFILYPTYYHQDPSILKPECRSWLGQDETGSPDEVTIGLCAELTDTVTLHDPEPLDALSAMHIWATAYMQDRYFWKPEKPLTLLLLKAYRLHNPLKLRVLPEYGGCRSWIELAEPVDVANRSAVLSEEDYRRERASVLDAVSAFAG